MREVVTGRATRGAVALILPIVVAAVLGFVLPSAAPASPAPPSLTCELSKAAVVYGAQVKAAGALDPAAAGRQVVVTVAGKAVGTATTDALGTYTLAFTPDGGGDVVARLVADPAVCSAPQALSVTPRVSVSHGRLAPFLPSAFVVKVAPATYDGRIAVQVVHHGAVAGSYASRVRDGKARLRIPLRGIDAFRITVDAPAAGGLDGRSLQVRVVVRARTLSAGSTGPYVKGMLVALQRLRFRVPGLGSSFTSEVKDAVVAFQKAYRLPRTYVFDTACWRKIDGAVLIKPRHTKPATHLEVDKGRQIAMVVKGGKPYGIICVSTGATGNTPEGTFHIQQKHSYTSSGFGGVLVRTMGFIGNFAMHGYAPVPPYPASHGCVREPIWACYWMYDQSWVGETLYIYH
jgi:N-acetylmuramoyl-L-alanine amidase